MPPLTIFWRRVFVLDIEIYKMGRAESGVGLIISMKQLHPEF
jgi:hypothetical protein